MNDTLNEPKRKKRGLWKEGPKLSSKSSKSIIIIIIITTPPSFVWIDGRAYTRIKEGGGEKRKERTTAFADTRGGARGIRDAKKKISRAAIFARCRRRLLLVSPLR